MYRQQTIKIIKNDQRATNVEKSALFRDFSAQSLQCYNRP